MARVAASAPAQDPLLPIVVAAALQLCLAAPMPKAAHVESARPSARAAPPADAAAYPPHLREAHALFHERCVKCHGLGVAGATALTAAQMKRHLRRPGFQATDDELRQIGELLKFDASRRATR